MEIKHDDKLPPEENVYVQVAMLYTSCGGQRRLRVMNLALKTCTQLADLFRSCDLDTLILFLAKQVDLIFNINKHKIQNFFYNFFRVFLDCSNTHRKSFAIIL